MVHAALVTTLLGYTDLFRALSEADRSAVAAQMREATYEAGQIVFSRGDPGGEMHLVVEGRIRLSVLSTEGRVLSFGHANRGDIFGEIAALDGSPRTADATALSRATTMKLASTSLHRLMEARPQLAQAAVAFVCRRLRTTTEQIEGIALHSAQVRLARYLLAGITLRGEGDCGAQAVTIDLGMSQTELGLLLGVSRSKVNEALAALQVQGAVNRVGGRLECNVGVLREVAEGE